jgi:hypothetical protein
MLFKITSIFYIQLIYLFLVPLPLGKGTTEIWG